eukprot:SAG11_NODE_3671_length_2294_cov_20.004100_1_plen_110_part_00
MPPSPSDRSKCPKNNDGAVAACQHETLETSSARFGDGQTVGERECTIACVIPEMVRQVSEELGLKAPIDANNELKKLGWAHAMNGPTHPSCAGHTVISEAVFNAIKHLL